MWRSPCSLSTPIALTLSLCVTACAGRPSVDLTAQACEQTQLQLKRRLGPELGRVVTRLPVPLTSSSVGCALVFSRVSEELPGEVLGEGESPLSQELALGLPNAQGSLTLNLMEPPAYRDVSVRLEAQLLELHGSAARELVIVEHPWKKSETYGALQAFAFAEGVPTPKEVISEPLALRTPEGLDVVARWRLVPFEGEQVLVLQGGGEVRLFKWHDGLQRFKLDLAASARFKRGEALSPLPPSLPSVPTSTGD